MPRSFTYSNVVKPVLVLRASPRARAPSAPMLFPERLRRGREKKSDSEKEREWDRRGVRGQGERGERNGPVEEERETREKIKRVGMRERKMRGKKREERRKREWKQREEGEREIKA